MSKVKEIIIKKLGGHTDGEWANAAEQHKNELKNKDLIIHVLKSRPKMITPLELETIGACMEFREDEWNRLPEDMIKHVILERLADGLDPNVEYNALRHRGFGGEEYIQLNAVVRVLRLEKGGFNKNQYQNERNNKEYDPFEGEYCY